MNCLPGNQVVKIENQNGDFVTPEFALNSKTLTSLEVMLTGTVTYDIVLEVSNSRLNWIELPDTEFTSLSGSDAPIGWDISTDFDWMRIRISNSTGTFTTFNAYLGSKA
jgi:hypothetical protein